MKNKFFFIVRFVASSTVKSRCRPTVAAWLDNVVRRVRRGYTQIWCGRRSTVTYATGAGHFELCRRAFARPEGKRNTRVSTGPGCRGAQRSRYCPGHGAIKPPLFAEKAPVCADHRHVRGRDQLLFALNPGRVVSADPFVLRVCQSGYECRLCCFCSVVLYENTHWRTRPLTFPGLCTLSYSTRTFFELRRISCFRLDSSPGGCRRPVCKYACPS